MSHFYRVELCDAIVPVPIGLLAQFGILRHVFGSRMDNVLQLRGIDSSMMRILKTWFANPLFLSMLPPRAILSLVRVADYLSCEKLFRDISYKVLIPLIAESRTAEEIRQEFTFEWTPVAFSNEDWNHDPYSGLISHNFIFHFFPLNVLFEILDVLPRDAKFIFVRSFRNSRYQNMMFARFDEIYVDMVLDFNDPESELESESESESESGSGSGSDATSINVG